jgi:hypothetical protein
MGDMVQPALLKVEGNSKNQVRHHHDHLEWTELIRAEPEWSERLTSRSRTRFGTDQHRGSGEVRDILILFPTVPEVCGPSTRLFALPSTSAIAFPMLGPPRRSWCCPSMRSVQ